MCNSVAIHFNVTAVAARNCRANLRRPAAVAAIHDMIDRARILDTQRPWHGPVLRPPQFSVNS